MTRDAARAGREQSYATEALTPVARTPMPASLSPRVRTSRPVYGGFAPAGVSSAIVAKLNHALNELIAEEKLRQRLAAVGVVVRGSSAEEFGTFTRAELKRLNAVREAAGIAQQ